MEPSTYKKVLRFCVKKNRSTWGFFADIARIINKWVRSDSQALWSGFNPDTVLISNTTFVAKSSSVCPWSSQSTVPKLALLFQGGKSTVFHLYALWVFHWLGDLVICEWFIFWELKVFGFTGDHFESFFVCYEDVRLLSSLTWCGSLTTCFVFWERDKFCMKNN